LGIHVTPTVVVNGIVVPSIESSTESENIVSILKDVTN
jgi:protein-disulfide isomerase